MLKNKIKTLILLSVLSSLLIFIGFSFGGNFGLKISIMIAFMTNFTAYFYADKIVLNLYGAEQLDREKYSKVYKLTEELANKMELPIPKLWLIDAKMANAFATGRNPHNASVAVTEEIMKILDERELRAVLAHELSHIRNRDILVTSIAAAIATAIGYLANLIQYTAIFGSDSNKKRSNPIGALLFAIFIPIIATMIQLAISRSREYLADETGAQCSHDPLALASALEKLHFNAKHNEEEEKNNTLKAATSSLFIVNPFTGIDWASLFSTHPPMYKRVEKLKKIYEKISLN